MKVLILLMFMSCIVTGQVDSIKMEMPGKIRVYNSFLSTKFEIGENSVNHKDVINHLQIHSQKGYSYYNRGRKQSRAAGLISMIGTGLLFKSFAGNNNESKLSYNLVSAAVLVPAVILSSSSRKNSKKGVDFFNREYGY